MRFVRVLPGFTLVELLIVMGVLGILVSVAVVAINPQRQLCSAQNAKRTAYEYAFGKALQEYAIRTTVFAGGDAVPTGEENAMPICAAGVTADPACVNLDVLVPDYLVELPVDATETDASRIGYAIYKTTLGRQYVVAQHRDTSCSNDAESMQE